VNKIIKEHDAVVLLRDLPKQNLVAGQTGVVYVYDNVHAFEVEFPNPNGNPRFLVETVEAADLLKLQPHTFVRRATG
jgi:hypothetical protein